MQSGRARLNNWPGMVTVDLCGRCKALWFDAFESVQLSPAGTLQLFRALHDAAATASVPLPHRFALPALRDAARSDAHDLQHATRFTYYRCRHGHGRFTPFVQFLREKNFIRPVSAADLDKLKKLVRIIRCSSCGAPVDLANANGVQLLSRADRHPRSGSRRAHAAGTRRRGGPARGHRQSGGRRHEHFRDALPEHAMAREQAARRRHDSHRPRRHRPWHARLTCVSLGRNKRAQLRQHCARGAFAGRDRHLRDTRRKSRSDR